MERGEGTTSQREVTKWKRIDPASTFLEIEEKAGKSCA
jgi:hypothetical protein